VWRQAGFYAAAAQWAEDVRQGVLGSTTLTQAIDLDFDGENEYVLKNDRIWAVWEKYGGRCVLAAAFSPSLDDAEVIVGAPYTNPSAPGEEEYTGASANRCSAFKEMNGGGYADAAYSAAAVAGGWQFTSPDGFVVKTFTAVAGSNSIDAQYTETVAGPLYVRLGLSPNPIDLATNGHANLTGQLRVPQNDYLLLNAAGGGAQVRLGTATWVPNPSFSGYNRRNIALTEEVEVSGDGSFDFELVLIPAGVTGAPEEAPVPIAGRLGLLGPFPSPSSGAAQLSFVLPERGAVSYRLSDLAGRLVVSRDLGVRDAGRVTIDLRAIDGSGKRLPAGLYFVGVQAAGVTGVRKWVVID
jgi:hypothetical protein